MNNKILRRIIWALTGLLMGFIFYMSSRSIELSRYDSARVMKLFGFVSDIDYALDLSNQPLLLVHIALRRWAHHILYAALGVLIFFSIYRLGKLYKSAALAFVFATAYGVTDEIHQMFSGRGASIYDVGEDAVGAFFGILVFMLFFMLIEKNEKLRRFINKFYDL